MHTVEVADRLQRHQVTAVEHDEQVGTVGQSGQQRQRVLGGRGGARHQRLDDVHAVVASPVREGATQGGGLHLLGGPLGVVARLRAVDDATTGELRGAGRALTGPAGALLRVGLAATTADFAAGLGGVRALTRGGQLGDDDLVDQRDVDLDVEDLGGQVSCDSRDGHLDHAPFAAERTRTTCRGGRERHP